MRASTLYRGLGLLSLAVASFAISLAAIAFGLRQITSVLASGLCAVVFLVPALAFSAEVRRIGAREAAFAHVASLTDSRGGMSAEELAAELKIPGADAEKILRKALAEGAIRGAMDERGRV